MISANFTCSCPYAEKNMEKGNKNSIRITTTIGVPRTFLEEKRFPNDRSQDFPTE